MEKFIVLMDDTHKTNWISSHETEEEAIESADDWFKQNAEEEDIVFVVPLVYFRIRPGKTKK